MYLVIGAAESSVKVTPMLLTVPFASTEEGWIYDVQAYPKAEKSNTVVFLVCCIRNIVMEAVFFINLHLIIQLDRLVILIKLEYIIGTSKNITVRSFA